MASKELNMVANIVPNTGQMDRAVRKIEQDVARIGRATKAAGNFEIANFGAAQRPMGKLVGLASEFEKSMEAANARVLAFGASVGVIVGVKNAFIGLVREALKFNDEMIKINTVLGASSQTLNKFGDDLFGIAQRTAQSIREVNAAALEFSRQGLSMEETLKRTESAMILTRLAGIDAADATKKLTAAVNSFKKEGLDVTNVLDRIIKVEQAFAVDTNDLTSAIERAGSTATEAGVKFNDFLGIVTAIQEKTARGGAVIGNAVKTIFSRLQSETRLANLENILNIKLFDEKDQPLQMVDRIKKIAMELKKITDPLKRERALFEIAGTYQKNIGSALIADVQEGDNSVLMRAAKQAENSAGSAAQKNNQLNQSLIQQFNIILEKIKEVGVTLADLGTNDLIQSLLSFVNKAVSSFDGLLNRTDALGGGIQNLIKGFSSLLGPAGVIAILVVGKFFIDFLKFAKDSVQSLLHINNVSNKQKIIETEILAILKEDQAARSILLNQSLSQVEIEERLSAIIASRIKQREAESKLVARASLGAATSGNFNVARGGEGGRLTTRLTDADIRKVQITNSAMGLSMAAAMQAEDSEKVLGGARRSDASRAIPIRTSGANVAKGVVNASEKVMDIPGFGTVVLPRNVVDEALLAGGISKDDMYKVLSPQIAQQAGLTGSNVSPIRSRAIRDLVDGYITSGFLGFKDKKVSNFDYPPEMLAAIRGDKMKNAIFFDLFGHWKDTYAGERKAGGEGNRANLSMLSKIVKHDPAVRGEFYNELKAGMLAFATSGGKISPALAMDSSFTKAYTLIKPTNSDDTAQRQPSRLPIETYLGRISHKGQKGSGILGSIFENTKKAIISSMPPNMRDKATGLLSQYKPKVWFPAYLDHALSPEAALMKAEKDPKFANKLKDVQIPYGRFTGEKEIKDKKGNIGWKYEPMLTTKKGFYGPGEIQNYAFGRIPNFAGPLNSAVQREMAAGIPSNRIYVDSHSSLKSPQNPLGLMVANTIDEPMGGYQGIARARRMGIDPKTHGIPNFAEPIFNPQDRFGKQGKGSMMGDYAILLNEEIGKLIKGLQKGNINLDQANAELAKIKSAFELSSDSLRKVNEGFNKALADQAKIQQKSQAQIEANRKRIFSNPSGMNWGGINSRINSGYQGRYTMSPNPVLANNGVPMIDNALGLGALPDSMGTDISQMRGVSKNPSLFNRISNRYNRLGDNTKMMAGFGLSMGLPTLGAWADSSLISRGRERSEMSIGERVGSSAFTEGLGFASSGLMIGGLWGAAIGAVVGLGVAASKASLSVEELDQAVQSRRDKFTESAQGAEMAAKLVDTFSRSDLSERDRMEAERTFFQSISKDKRLTEMYSSADLKTEGGRKKLIEQFNNYADEIYRNMEIKSRLPNNAKIADEADRLSSKFLMETGDKNLFQQEMFGLFSTLSRESLLSMEDALKKSNYNPNDLQGEFSSLGFVKKYMETFGRDSNEAKVAKVFQEAIDSIDGSSVKEKKDAEFFMQLFKRNLELSRAAKENRLTKDPELEDLRTGQVRLRGQLFEFDKASRSQDLGNQIIGRMQAINLEVKEALLANLDKEAELIQERAATLLAANERDLASNLRKAISSQMEFFSEVNPDKFGGLSAKDLRTQYVEPAGKLAAAGDAAGLSSLLQSLTDRIPATALEKEDLAIKNNIEALIEQVENLNKLSQLQSVEIQVRTLLNTKLSESEKSIQRFVQSINEAQAQFNYRRIGERGQMEIGLNRARYQASRFDGAPWEIEANNIEVQRREIIARRDFDAESIRKNALFETKKIMAQQNNTLAIQGLTNVLLKFLADKEEELFSGIKDPAERNKIKNEIAGMTKEQLEEAAKSSGTTPDQLLKKKLAETEITRRSATSASDFSAVTQQVFGGFNGQANAQAALAEAERIRMSGGEITQQAIADAIGGEAGGIISALKPEQWQQLWQSLNDPLMALAENSTNASVALAELGDQAENANKKAYYEFARQNQRRGLLNTISDLENMPGTTPDQMVEARQALARFDREDPFGKFIEGLELAFARIQTEILSFENQLGQNIPNLFRDNMAAAISDITTGAKSIEDALLGAASSFFMELNKAFSQQAASQITNSLGSLFGIQGAAPQKFASGGMVRGGSGVRDDVPAMLTSGEYVVKRSAAQKYGTGFLDSLNSGRVVGFASGGSVGGNLAGAVVTGALGQYFASKVSSPQQADELTALMTLKKYGKQSGPEYFIPGVNTPDGKYQGAISGPKNLLNFGKQGYTVGSMDRISGSGEDMSVRLEDESLRLGIQGRLNSDIAQEVYGAKEQALGLYYGWQQDQLRLREEEKAQKDAQKQQLIASIASAVIGSAVSAGTAGFQSSYAKSAETGGGFFQNVGAGVKGIWSGAEVNGETFGGISNIFSGSGFTTYGGRALDIETGKPFVSQQGRNPVSLASSTSPARRTTSYDAFGLPETFSGDLMPDINAARSAFYNPNVPSPNAGYWMEMLLNGELNRSSVDPDFLNGFYGGDGMVLPPKYMKGGSVPAMLNSGEYIMNSASASRIGKSTMTKLNRGAMPMVSGGEVGSSYGTQSANDKLLMAVEKLDQTTKKPEINITINIDKSGNTTETKDSKNEQEENRKLSEKIKVAVQKAISEEKRQGGLLR